MKIKDQIGILVGASFLGPTLGAIGSHMGGAVRGIGAATQTVVAGGFLGHTASKVKGKIKW